MERRRYVKKLFEGEALELNLLTMTAHELKSPLTLISGLSSMLLEQEGANGSRRTDLTRIMRASDRLLALVEGLVATGKLSHGHWQLEREPVRLLRLLTAVAEELEPRLLDKQLKLKIDRSYSLPPVLADYDCLYHVVYNLLDNAIKYSPRKSKILIRPQRDHHTVIIDIENSGQGVKTSQLEQLLQRRSRRGKQPLRSTGLGLYIVNSLVEAQGGAVMLNLKPNAIRFRVRLPLLQQLSLFAPAEPAAATVGAAR